MRTTEIEPDLRLQTLYNINLALSMPTAARQNMLSLAISVKVYYKRNTIVFLIELKRLSA